MYIPKYNNTQVILGPTTAKKPPESFGHGRVAVTHGGSTLEIFGDFFSLGSGLQPLGPMALNLLRKFSMSIYFKATTCQKTC